MDIKEDDLTYTGIAASEAAKSLELQQIAKYHTKGGHGFSAEDANALSDRISLKQVDVTGTSNETNGPDRIVDNVKIQTKYYQTPKGTIEAAFDSKSGIYRYDGQLLEVPLDQYDDCLRMMENKIRENKVPGITDPAEAKNLVKKGTVTYRQARNIARAGNIDSLRFDAKTQAVTSSYVFAISFLISYSRAKWNGKTDRESAAHAVQVALSAGTTTFVTGVITAQILRTRSAAIGAVAMRSGVKFAYKSSLGKQAVEKLAQASLGKAVYGAAALNHVSKLLRSNIITSAIATVVVTTPDFYRAALARNISWAQFTKNLLVNVSGVATGVGGWMGGAIVGTAVGGPVGGIVGGIVGAVSGGSVGSAGAKIVADQFAPDDAQQMTELIQKVSEQLLFEYLMSESEVQTFAKRLQKMVNAAWLRKMYCAGNKGSRSKSCREFARQHLEHICESIVKKRQKIKAPDVELVQHEIDNLANNVCLA